MGGRDPLWPMTGLVGSGVPFLPSAAHPGPDAAVTFLPTNTQGSLFPTNCLAQPQSPSQISTQSFPDFSPIVDPALGTV